MTTYLLTISSTSRNPTVESTLKGPDNATLAVSGRVTLSICRSAFSDFAVDTTVYVVPHLKTPLLGRPAIEALHIFSPPADLLSATTGTSEQSSVKSQYPELFAGVGSFGSEHTIRLVDNAQPYSLPTPRRISLPMEAKVIEELQALEQSGVIRKVTEPTDWCAGMVVVPKPNGNVRICGDFTRLNQAIRRERHIMPTTDHLLARLGTAKVFSKLDANKGFHQIPLSLESQLLTTFITPIGRFCFRRLPFGISSAPEYFQKQMSDLLSDLPGTICMIDDVLTFSDDEHEEEKNLHAVLQRLSSAGITLNPDKCAFHQRSVKFLGHILDDNGIHPDPQKVRGVQELKRCTDVPAVRRFLGMANQLGKFVPDLATMSQPLRALLVKGQEWSWTEEHQAAFDAIKSALSSHPVLAMYSTTLDTIISADASSFGLGAVLLQVQSDGSIRPVAYQSRSLTPAETRYSQIEKEALASTWACDRFEHFVLGKPFTIQTDHKPLIPLLGSRALDDLPPRIVRFRLRLLRFNFRIVHVPGKDLAIADALSRAPVSSEQVDSQDVDLLAAETAALVDYAVDCLPATTKRLDDIAEWQESDQVCESLARYCADGWPHSSDAPSDVRPYVEHRAHITLTDDGLLLYNDRLIIPASHRDDILSRLHTGHQGIAKCRRLARNSVWWPSINSDIQLYVANCSTCARMHTQPAEPLIPTTLPDLPWQRLAADLFHFGSRDFLLLVDYYSRYIEVVQLTSTSSKAVITHLQSIFARHGIPETLMSDNGPQFASEEFRRFAEEFSFQHVTSSPLYPQANGLAERSVKTVKHLFTASPDWYSALLTYRNTPLESGYSPAQLLMGRQLRSRVPLSSSQLQPQLISTSDFAAADAALKARQTSNYNDRHRTRSLPPLQAEQPVYLTDRHETGTVLRQPAIRSYVVSTPSGEYRRNRRHIVALPSAPPVAQVPKAASAPDTTPPRPPQPTTTSTASSTTSSTHSAVPTSRTTSAGTTITRSGRTVMPPDRYGFSD